MSLMGCLCKFPTAEITLYLAIHGAPHYHRFTSHLFIKCLLLIHIISDLDVGAHPKCFCRALSTVRSILEWVFIVRLSV